MASPDFALGSIAFIVAVDAVGRSVNQIEPSDFTTTSFGELSRLPRQ
jgi:hypothetical protein